MRVWNLNRSGSSVCPQPHSARQSGGNQPGVRRGTGGAVEAVDYLSKSRAGPSDPVAVVDLPSDRASTDMGVSKAHAVGAVVRRFASHEEDSANRAADSAARGLTVGLTRVSALTFV